jgi:hypothetical protein
MVNERKLSKAELSKREDIIMNMKDNKRDLVKKYGKDAEAVMYGRATNMAKKQTKEMRDPKLTELIKDALKNPKKADLNKDGKLSDYEEKRGSAIEKNVSEDLDLGHEDNEPHMLKSDLYHIGKCAMDLYNTLDQFDDEGEVDLPSWWQSKIFKAKEALVGAEQYLDFELNEPKIDAVVDVAVDVVDETVEDFITSVDDLDEGSKYSSLAEKLAKELKESVNKGEGDMYNDINAKFKEAKGWGLEMKTIKDWADEYYKYSTAYNFGTKGLKDLMRWLKREYISKGGRAGFRNFFGDKESVNEADTNSSHKSFVNDIYKAVGVIDTLLSKNRPPSIPKDIWGKLYGMAGDITDKADQLLVNNESVNEGLSPSDIQTATKTIKNYVKKSGSKANGTSDQVAINISKILGWTGSKIDQLDNYLRKINGGSEEIIFTEGMSSKGKKKQIKDIEDSLKSGKSDGESLTNETEMLLQKELKRLKSLKEGLPKGFWDKKIDAEDEDQDGKIDEDLKGLMAQGEKIAAFANKQSGYEGGVSSPVRGVLAAMTVAGAPDFDGDDEMVSYYTRRLTKAIETQKGKKYMSGFSVDESYATVVNKIKKSGKSEKAAKAIAGAVASYKAKGGGKGPTAKQK